jgi:hypothetical protein
MPRKRIDERPYDPISADLVRDATSLQTRGFVSMPPISLAPVRTGVVAPDAQVEPTITKRFVLTRSEDADVEAFVLRLQRAARTKVPLGVVLRAALAVVMEAEAKLCALVERQTFRLPSTHDRLALGEFEDQWRQSLVRALR